MVDLLNRNIKVKVKIKIKVKVKKKKDILPKAEYMSLIDK